MTKTKQTLKAGTRIEVFGIGLNWEQTSEPATIGRWTAVNGPIKNHVSPTNGGWHVIRYADGGSLLCHESGFRIVDNR